MNRYNKLNFNVMKKTIILLFVLLSINKIQAQDAKQSPEEISINLVNQGQEKANTNNWTDAITDYNNAIVSFPKNTLAYYYRATARYNLKDYRGAIMDYSKAIYLDGSNNTAAGSGSYYGRGMCYYSLGMKDKACIDLIKANDLGFQDASNAIQNYCN
jgi:tetratricopeptide (TPR) repeat protein